MLVIGLAKLSIIVRFMYGARFKTSAVISSVAVSSSSSVTISVMLQIPPSLQLNSVQQSSESILSISPGFFSIAKRHSTSPPSISKLVLAFNVTFSKVYTPSETDICAVGTLPTKISTLAKLLLLFPSSVTVSSGSTEMYIF